MRAKLVVSMVAVIAGTMLASTQPAQAFKKWNVFPQSYFKFCFTSQLNEAEKARFRDGLRSWSTRGIPFDWDEVSCSDNSALTVRKQVIGDGRGGTAAVTRAYLWGSRYEIVFDSEETWWSGTSKPACELLDFWAVAAHEIGHVWGLDDIYGNIYAPEGGLKTMESYTPLYPCPEVMSTERTLTSDDEAGGLYIDQDHYMPNWSFERGTCDNVSPTECAPNYYWIRTNTSWPRACNSNAEHGSCYQRMLGIGTIEQTVRRYACNLDGPGVCTGHIGFWWQVRASGGSTIRVRVFDMSAEPDLTLADTTCSADPWAWRFCLVNFNFLITTGERAYKYAITNQTTSPEYWVDSVSISDDNL